jgi:iron complex outermembrane recepter protein
MFISKKKILVASICVALSGTVLAEQEQVLKKIHATTDSETDYVADSSNAGTKTDTPLIETPQSITVMTSEQIAAQGANSVAQALRYVGGVTSEPRGVMTGLDYFYARGFALNQFVDGLKTSVSGYSLPQPDPYLLERVEVLRGPASVLYGQAEPGGVLNLVSKRPTRASFGEAELQVGNNSRLQGSIDLNGALSDTVTARITAVARDADSQVDYAKEQRFAVAPALTWQPSEKTSLTLLGNYQNDPHVGYYNWITAYGTVLPNPAHPDTQLPTSLNTGEPSFDKYARKNYSLGAIFEHRFNDTWQFRENLRWSHVESEFDNVYSSYLDADYETLNRYVWRLQDDIDALNSDTQLVASFNTGTLSHTVLFGVDYSTTNYHQLLGYNFDSGTGSGQVPPLNIYVPVYGAPVDVPDFAGDSQQKQHRTGLYAQDQIKIGHWNLLIGARHDESKSETAERFYDTLDKQDDSATTGRAGVVYVFDSGLAPYASYTESFQPVSGTDFAGTPFNPTTGKQYEVGLKFQPVGSAGFAMLSIYDLKQQNVLSSDVQHPGESVQTGEIGSRGFELTGVANVSERVDLVASLSRVNQEVTRSGVRFGPALGKTPAGTAADNASLWTDYKFGGVLSGFGIGGGVRYTGFSWGDDDNTFKVPSYTLVDATAHYAFNEQSALAGWMLRLNVTNLFDKTYVASCGGTDYCGYGFRRTILGTVSRHW